MTNNKFDLNNINCVRDLTPENAANYSGGAVGTTDVTLTSKSCGQGHTFNSNKGIENLKDFGFDNATKSITVNNDKTWRFYEDPNFKGEFVDVKPNQSLNVGKFGKKISSFKAVD